jgi:hydrogenase maturation protease
MKRAEHNNGATQLCERPWRAEVYGILIIAYGNALRGDDAVGLYAARELDQQFHDDPEIDIIACQQLTPEMADDVSGSELVIFLDASCGEEPGTVRCKHISPLNGPVGLTHNLDPQSLVSAAEQLYGEAPQAICVTLAGWSFEVSNRLSKNATLRLPELVRQTREIITTHRKQLPVAAAFRPQ